MTTTLIIDDEQDAREVLVKLLRLYCKNIKIIGEAASLDAALGLINQLKPQLLFLDIRLGNQSAFDLLNQLDYKNFQLIFVTGYEEYAIKAFEENAIDYLLKPLDPDRLVQAVEKATQNIPFRDFSQQLERLFEENKRDNKFPIITNKGTHYIAIDKIILIESDTNASVVHIEGQEKIYSNKNLKHYKNRLPQDLFIEVHQSFVVNLNHIIQTITEDGFTLVMTQKQQVPVARRKKEEVQQRLKDKFGE